MLVIAILLAVVLALVTLLLAVAEAAIRLNDEDDRSTDGIAFTRMAAFPHMMPWCAGLRACIILTGA